MSGGSHSISHPQPENRQRMLSLGVFIGVLLCALASPAYALDLGQIISNAGAFAISGPVRTFVSGLAYIIGAILVATGLRKLIRYMDDPGRNNMAEPWMYLFAGAALVALPWFIFGSLLPSLLGDEGSPYWVNEGETIEGGTGEGLDARFISFVSNINGPLRFAISAVCWLIGIVMAFNGIVRLTKVAQQGPKGPAGAGTIMTFIVAAILLSIGNIMNAVSVSVLGSQDFTTNYQLVAIPAALGSHGQMAQSAFQAALIFVQLVGWLAFARGWLLIRDIVDGTSKSSMLSGFTHVVGGALAANIGLVLQALQATLGITIIS